MRRVFVLLSALLLGACVGVPRNTPPVAIYDFGLPAARLALPMEAGRGWRSKSSRRPGSIRSMSITGWPMKARSSIVNTPVAAGRARRESCSRSACASSSGRPA